MSTVEVAAAAAVAAINTSHLMTLTQVDTKWMKSFWVFFRPIDDNDNGTDVVDDDDENDNDTRYNSDTTLRKV